MDSGFLYGGSKGEIGRGIGGRNFVVGLTHLFSERLSPDRAGSLGAREGWTALDFIYCAKYDELRFCFQAERQE